MVNFYVQLCNRHFSGDIGVERSFKRVIFLGKDIADVRYGVSAIDRP